jgi:hypothetical protein
MQYDDAFDRQTEVSKDALRWKRIWIHPSGLNVVDSALVLDSFALPLALFVLFE